MQYKKPWRLWNRTFDFNVLDFLVASIKYPILLWLSKTWTLFSQDKMEKNVIIFLLVASLALAEGKNKIAPNHWFIIIYLF